MNQPVRSSIGQIFLQIIIALFIFATLAGMAAAQHTPTHEDQAKMGASGQAHSQHVTVFNALDQQTLDRQLAGRLKASLAFDRQLFKQAINVSVDNNQVTLSGQVATQLLLDKAVEKALLLVTPQQLTLQLQVLSSSDSQTGA